MADTASQQQAEPSTAAIATRLGMNRSTGALLLAILLIGMGQELWAPFMPKFIQESIEAAKAGRPTFLSNLGLSQAAVIILAVGLFGFWKDLQEGVYYYLGGRIGGTLGTRKALIGFALLPLVGYALLLTAVTPGLATIMAFAALPFITAYDSISQPATLTVVGDTLKAQHRTMAISLQSIQRRISRIFAYLIGGALVYTFGAVMGVKMGVALSVILVLLAVLVQVKMLRTDTKDTAKRSVGFSFRLIRRFPSELKKLLVADILARMGEGMPRELFVLYAVAMSAQVVNAEGFGVFGINASTFGVLLAVQSMTSLLLYVPIGWLASRPGAQKKPFITLTFVFFALFPLAFWGLGTQFGLVGLVIAYVIAGLREIGEPARKAMITELVPQDAKTAATGLYWSVRTFSVMLAPMIGAAVWLLAGPEWVFISASMVGIIGAAGFLLFVRSKS
ncbi:MAG: MFS transporter [Phycisphaerales bacterium]|nr:MFS transporter [Phycisphaerales bacterium]MCI0629353.1 MFS transporter [Phycisphaerales bacterium]MCI0674340.1 MFS transporter [Phycisphaerales bacterium]